MSRNNGHPEDDQIVAMLDQQIEQEKAALAALDHQRAPIQRRLRSLRAARRALVAGVSPVTLTASRIAGPKLMGQVRRLLAKGPLPQNEIARRVGRNSGSVSYALKALVEQGEIEDTGERRNRSRVFAVKGRRSVVRPGE